MSTFNTGGTAFPHEYKFGDGTANRHDGMTLRDYFAAKAMQGFAASSDNVGWRSMDHIAETAYEWADAMLRARDQS